MNEPELRFTDGTSALKPDCSRYRNENERIIDFGSAAETWEAEIDYDRLARARHARAPHAADIPAEGEPHRTSLIKAMRVSGIAGKPFGLRDAWKMKLYGCLYTAAALAAIIAVA